MMLLTVCFGNERNEKKNEEGRELMTGESWVEGETRQEMRELVPNNRNSQQKSVVATARSLTKSHLTLDTSP